MHLEKGHVKEVREGRALIECDPESECSGCAARHTCMASQNPKKRALWVENTIGAAEGEVVLFRIEETGVVWASLILYLFPVLCLIAGIAAGAGPGRDAAAGFGVALGKDHAAGIGGIIGLVISFAVMFLMSGRISKKDIFRPVLVEQAADEHERPG